jgi:hypothetical protein
MKITFNARRPQNIKHMTKEFLIKEKLIQEHLL